jgi:hypothetical protein
MVNPKRKWIYTKPCRTAGTSIFRYCLERHFYDEMVWEKNKPREFMAWLDGMDDGQLTDYFIWSVVRNPWDRVVSITEYLNIPLAHFVQRWKHCRRDPSVAMHSHPQVIYAYHGKERFADLVCSFEQLDKDFAHVAREIGLPDGLTLSKTSRTSHGHYSSYYDTYLRKRVAKIYAKDIELFGYGYDHHSTTQASA